MAKFEVRVKKTQVSYCWISVAAKDVAYAEKNAMSLAPKSDVGGDFSADDGVVYSVDECCEVMARDKSNT